MLARDAFRRPVTEGDMKLLMKFYRTGRKEKDAAAGFDTGIREVVTAVLASPFFLYRAERTPAELVATSNTGGAAPALTATQSYRITDLELASRLSFFLWSTCRTTSC